MNYSKYFPNNQEYASKVYKDFSIKKRRKKQKRSKSADAKFEHSPTILYPTDLKVTILEPIDIPPEGNPEETSSYWTYKKRRKHPEASTCATQTEAVDTIQTYTQTDNKSVHEMAIQTLDEEVTDSPKINLVDTSQIPTFEFVDTQQSSTEDTQKSTTPSPEQNWNEMKKDGDPRIVVSVIGAYNERMPSYAWDDHSLFIKALNHVARYAGSCGFIFKEEDTDFLQSIVKKSCAIEGLPQTYGYFSVHLLDDEKHEQEIIENKQQPTHETRRHFKDDIELLELENYINSTGQVPFEDRQNSTGQVPFEDGQKALDKLSTIRVPVALLVLNGDLDTLEHVLRAIYSDMSVVVVKGTGGAADLIALCLKDFAKLKRELPIMFARRFTKSLFNKIQEVIKLIIQKEWMISVFDIKMDEHDTLWERITDGILRAWSFEEKLDEEILKTQYLPLNEGVYISEYVADQARLTRRELFAGYNSKPKLTQQNKQNVFVTCFLGEKTDVLEQILEDEKEFKLPKKKFDKLWKKEINSIKTTSFYQLLQSLCSSDIDDVEAIAVISQKLLKGLCFSKIGITTCCKCKPADPKDTTSMPTIEILRLAVLVNRRELAAILWYNCDNPIMTALISSIYLTSLANTAEQTFDEKDQEELQNHADLFLSRAIQLLEKMFSENERLAIDALDYVSEVWEHNESPLHFGHQFNIEEFISHPSNQKDASKRLFSNNLIEDKNTKSYQRTRSKLAILTSPAAMMVFQVIFFIAALIMFSFFLTLNLQDDLISLQEVLIFIYMLGDLLEEIWSMIRPESDKECIWSPQRIFLHLFNIWNIMDLLCLILYILAFCMHILDSNLLVHIRRIYSIALFIMFLRLLNILLLFKRFGIIIIMVKEMLVDLMQYLLILLIFIFAAGIVYHANVYPNHTVAGSSDIHFWRIWTILKIPYWQVYGELFLDTLEAADDSGCTNNATLWKTDPSVERCPTADWITPVIAAFYMMLTNWLLLNIVIAMFSSRFETIRQKSKQKWRYYRHSVVLDYEHKIPSPLNFPCRIVRIIKYARKQKCCCCSACSEDNKKDTEEEFLKKQRQFAREIIEEEKNRKTI